MSELPETILQFGGGNFLRAFVDLFVEQANASGQAVGRIVVVQSTTSGVADQINAQSGRYHVIVRGLLDGKRIDEPIEVSSVSRAIDAHRHWDDVLEFARGQTLKWIVSNTTEAGLALSDSDAQRPTAGGAPTSFPAKLLDVLWTRWDAGGRDGVAILPCELLPKNGERLRGLVMEQARRWGASTALVDHLADNCRWANSLVDRIVSGKPAHHRLLEDDALLTVTEPFAFWAVQRQPGLSLFDHPAVQMVEDVSTFELRKIRILNGAHTALVARAMPLGIETVRAAVEDPRVGPWLRRLLDEEIVPTIRERVTDADGFARTTLERFGNPFLEHKLSAIAAGHETKLKTRLVPTRDEFVARFGKRPPMLDAILG